MAQARQRRGAVSSFHNPVIEECCAKFVLKINHLYNLLHQFILIQISECGPPCEVWLFGKQHENRRFHRTSPASKDSPKACWGELERQFQPSPDFLAFMSLNLIFNII